MRQGPNNPRRSRGRGNNNNNNNNNGGRRHHHQQQNVPLRHQTFDSNGPDVRIRGTAFQVHEKYLALARDATAAGDRVAAENYYQHAEHYHRIISLIVEAEQARQQQPRMDHGGRANGYGRGDGQGGFGDEMEAEETGAEEAEPEHSPLGI